MDTKYNIHLTTEDLNVLKHAFKLAVVFLNESESSTSVKQKFKELHKKIYSQANEQLKEVEKS